MYATVAVLFLCLSAFLSGSATAADGDLDSSFGTAGIVSDPYTETGGAGFALQSDRMIVVAEIDTSGLQFIRYDTSGMLDPTFGVGGIVTQPAPAGQLDGLVALPSGHLLLLAYGSGTYLLARYDAAGAPDPGFGVGGVATLPDCGTEYGTVADLTVQSDGKIVVGMASIESGTDPHACVVRVDSSGVPDAGFGTGGVAALPNWFVDAVAMQGDRVVVGGWRYDGSMVATAVTRLKSDGAVDGGFGSGGAFIRADSPARPVAGLALRTNGILAVTTDAKVLSLTTNGDADASFGTNGVAVIEAPGGLDISGGAIVLQADGKSVVATTIGESHPPIGFLGGVQLTRFDVDGTVDTSFGSGGTTSDSVGGFLSGLVMQPDGKILVAGVTLPNIIFPAAAVSVGRHLGLTLPCPPAPATGCRGSTASFAGKLRMDAAATNPKAKMQWSWQKGAATVLPDFGDPVGGDDYALCLYDESGVPTLATAAVVPGGGTCKGKPCWKALGTSGLAYKDPARLRFGIAALKLKAGVDGKAQVKIQGQGTTLPVPALPAPLPLRLQLIAENGQCWESVFSTTGLTRNDAERFQGKSD